MSAKRITTEPVANRIEGRRSGGASYFRALALGRKPAPVTEKGSHYNFPGFIRAGRYVLTGFGGKTGGQIRAWV